MGALTCSLAATRILKIVPLALGGPPAGWPTGEASGPAYWRKVWAAAVCWNWDEVAVPAVLSALDDQAWRVREMALKVRSSQNP